MAIGRTSATLTAALIACATTLTGCSSDTSDAVGGSSDQGTERQATSAPSINTDAISPPDLVTPPVLKPGSEGARKDVTLDKCEPKEGEQSVKGKIVSTAKGKADYLVLVNWVNGSDVMGRGYALVRGVEPGKETPFEVKANVTRKSTACTVNVTRGTVDETSLKTAAAAVTTKA